MPVTGDRPSTSSWAFYRDFRCGHTQDPKQGRAGQQWSGPDERSPYMPPINTHRYMRPKDLFAATRQVLRQSVVAFHAPFHRSSGTFGFRAGHQPSELTRTLVSLVEAACGGKRPVHTITVDRTKAQDRVIVEESAVGLRSRQTPSKLAMVFARQRCSGRFAFDARDREDN